MDFFASRSRLRSNSCSTIPGWSRFRSFRPRRVDRSSPTWPACCAGQGRSSVSDEPPPGFPSPRANNSGPVCWLPSSPVAESRPVWARRTGGRSCAPLSGSISSGWRGPGAVVRTTPAWVQAVRCRPAIVGAGGGPGRSIAATCSRSTSRRRARTFPSRMPSAVWVYRSRSCAREGAVRPSGSPVAAASPHSASSSAPRRRRRNRPPQVADETGRPSTAGFGRRQPGRVRSRTLPGPMHATIW
jgi:hypothetical protein